ncbi:hypothetical protein [Alteromonas sp. a30]|uniref:hypothetical protein n=1 Tax=Alteromonas sp. a30 TaxID=2730917 RepID=UPI0022827BD9|nr:hypothetical protein [Alteromonas sp. a30]MCY7297214.1 hypothetical protein [Alteromonas sp. a30]
MKFVFTLLFSLGLFSQYAEANEFLEKIKLDARSIEMDPHQFIYSTQVLAQNKYRSKDEKHPLPDDFFKLMKAGSEFWEGKLNPNTTPPIGVRMQLLPKSVKMINELVFNHANELNLSLLDLSRFYSLKENNDYAELFKLDAYAAVPDGNIGSYTIELQCKIKSQDCNRSFNRVDPNQVAAFWQELVEKGIKNKQLFTVMYIDVDGSQVGKPELWRFYSTFGPRYLEDIE